MEGILSVVYQAHQVHKNLLGKCLEGMDKVKPFQKTRKVFFNWIFFWNVPAYYVLIVTVLFLKDFLWYKHNYEGVQKVYFSVMKYFWVYFSVLLSSQFIFFFILLFFSILSLDFIILDYDGLFCDLKMCLNSFHIFQKKPVFTKSSFCSVRIYFYFLHYSNYLKLRSVSNWTENIYFIVLFQVSVWSIYCH